MQRRHTEPHPDPPITLSHTGENSHLKNPASSQTLIQAKKKFKPPQQPTQTYNMRS
jgi:hypothetical protein